jgi:VPDSG-CTERM motif
LYQKKKQFRRMQMKTATRRFLAVMVFSVSLAAGGSTALAIGFTLGDAANYAVLYEGAGGNHLNINNGPGIGGLAVNGNIGIDNTGRLQLSGPLTLNSDVHFANSVIDNGPYSGNIVVNGTISGGHANVHNDLLYLNGLSGALGALAGTSLTISGNQTVNVSAGMLDVASGNMVFTANTASFNNGETVTIIGDGIHNVVFNFSGNATFGGEIVLGGGLTSDQVLFNMVGGTNLTGGPTLQINNNFSGTGDHLTGTFLNPNGQISIVNAVLDGRIFGGDTHDMQIVSGAEINAPPGVPDAGSTLVLLGAGLGFLGVARRKLLA